MILITGATGRIGRATVRLLAEEHGIWPRVLVRDLQRAKELLPAGVDCVKGDYDEPSSLAPALDGVDKVLLISPVNPRQVEWQGNVVDAAAADAHIVKISGLGTGLDSAVSSGLWHAQTEDQIARSGRPYTFLRPYFFMQNLAFQLDSARKDGKVRAAVGQARIAMVDVADIAAVVASVLARKIEMENEIHALTGAAHDYFEVAALFSELLGREVAYEQQTLDEVRQRLLQSGQPEWHTDLVVAFHRAFREDGAAAVDPTVERALGRPPRTLRQCLEDHLQAAGALGRNPFPS